MRPLILVGLLLVASGCATEPEEHTGSITITFPCAECPAPNDTTITVTP